MTLDKVDEECINNIRILAADIVDKANSGHPGAPMGMAPFAHLIWGKVMNYSPADPKWPSRDRFVLSNGHACALLYTMLHLSGFKLTMDDLKSFRQLHSKCPGHPECHMTEGVECTTGPLGQGIANAVGLAIAEENLRATYNKPGFDVINNFTYVFCGDGCLQEGVSAEASSLAGHLGLGRLIILYDDNGITIDGHTDLSFSEDVLARYKAYGWHTQTVLNGDNNLAGLEVAVKAAQAVTDKPSIIAVKTIIGYGSEKQGTHGIHGSPLGAKDTAGVKQKFGYDPKQHFVVKPEVAQRYAAVKAKGSALVAQWNVMMSEYSKKHPELATEFKRRFRGELPEGWAKALPKYDEKSKADSTRNLSGHVLNALAKTMPELIGGSADLTPSNMTELKGVDDFQVKTRRGRYLRFGIREHGMAAIGNGLHAYGGMLPFTATFFNFIEYAFPAVRLSALSHHQQLYVMTHDSIGLGEDGPTHQPIEAAALCRATPNILTFRPADGNETAGAYKQAILHKSTPSVLILSRQGMNHVPNSSHDAVALGAYVCVDCNGKPDLILIGTGSEVGLCISAAEQLTKKGIKVRVVSMPCWELFDAQLVSYRRKVLTPGVATIAVECLSTTGWEKYSHTCFGMTTFGESAPIKDVMKHFGYTPDQVTNRALNYLSDTAAQAKELGQAPFGLLSTHIAGSKL